MSTPNIEKIENTFNNLNNTSNNDTNTDTNTNTNTDHESKIKFKTLVEKMKLEEYNDQVDEIIYNQETLILEQELDQKYKEKFETCRKIYKKIKDLTEEENIETLESGRLLFKSKPKSGRELQFDSLVKKFNNCHERFFRLDNIHQSRVAHLNKFSSFSLNICLEENCQKLFSGNNKKTSEDEENTKVCIRDCFHHDKINKFAMIHLMNEEYIKFIKAIENIQI